VERGKPKEIEVTKTRARCSDKEKKGVETGVMFVGVSHNEKGRGMKEKKDRKLDAESQDPASRGEKRDR